MENTEDGHEFTSDEIAEKVVHHFWGMMHYWLEEKRAPTIEEKMEGFLFSVFAALDGSSMALPSFLLAPCPHPDDRAYHKEENRSWYPENHQFEPLLQGQ